MTNQTEGADTLSISLRGNPVTLVEKPDGSLTVTSDSGDIWGTADDFRYAWKRLSGDGSIVVRVDSLVDTWPWAKAGVMIRQDTSPGSQHSFMPISGGGGNGASWQGRVSEGVASVNTDATDPVATPYWVRIDRAGDSLTGSISVDGETWTQLGDPREVVMDGPVLIGLALTSHNVNQATSAQFSNVSFTGNVTGAWQIAEIGVALLLFTIGLEFSAARLQALGTSVLKIGPWQVVLTATFAYFGGHLLGVGGREALVIGMMIAMSSTACVLRLLTDRAEIETRHGRAALRCGGPG